MNYLPPINPEAEINKIVNFIQETLKEQRIEKVVLGLSGGIDSTTTLYLLKKAISKENIIASHLYYFDPLNLEQITYDIPNIHNISIKEPVENLSNQLKIIHAQDKIRFGNVAARIRMIALYDLAKKNKALVCGTENKSEFHLGYFTRFGDEASDFEPLIHLYKNQVYQLANYLKVPKEIISKKPSANLWQNQTDEDELGFSYEEADQVLYLYFDKKIEVKEIIKKGLLNAEKIINYCQKNTYKHHTPYVVKY